MGEPKLRPWYNATQLKEAIESMGIEKALEVITPDLITDPEVQTGWIFIRHGVKNFRLSLWMAVARCKSKGGE